MVESTWAGRAVCLAGCRRSVPAAACFRPASHRLRLAPGTHVSLAAQRLHAKPDQEADTRCSCHQSEQQQEAASSGVGGAVRRRGGGRRQRVAAGSSARWCSGELV